jgi:type IV secretory pathway TrbF-like protein
MTHPPVVPAVVSDPARPNPGRPYMELYAAAIVTGHYLRLTVVLVSLIALGLLFLNVRSQAAAQHVKPLVVRIDAVGRATAIHYDAWSYTPQVPEMKYFLVQFARRYYGRTRATVKRDYADALYFLDGRLADAVMVAKDRTAAIEKFLADGSDEWEIAVRNVAIEDLSQPPFKASIDFDRIAYSVPNHQETKRDTFVAHVVFVLRSDVPNTMLPVNPLGLCITSLREDQAFR